MKTCSYQKSESHRRIIQFYSISLQIEENFELESCFPMKIRALIGGKFVGNIHRFHKIDCKNQRKITFFDHNYKDNK